ncbi:MAG: hypothetical protein PVI40_05795 [Chlamydiota bacterium]|jgi:hypothetical protein
MILLTTATEIEARAIIQKLKLKKLQDPYFSIWQNEEVILIITGIGKVKTASAIAYVFAITKSSIKAAINFGLAGHKHLDPGLVFLAHKIMDFTNGKSFYPGISFSFKDITSPLTTFDLPYTFYEIDSGYDMEGVAFFETCLQFLPLDVIHCLKTVSDSAKNPLPPKLDKNFFLYLMKASLSSLEDLITTLTSMNKLLFTPPSVDLSFFMENWNFTESEKNILSDVLQRLMILEKPYKAEDLKSLSKDEVLQGLKRLL